MIKRTMVVLVVCASVGVLGGVEAQQGRPGRRSLGPPKKLEKRPVKDILAAHQLTGAMLDIGNLRRLQGEDPFTQMRAYASAPNRGATPPAVTAHPTRRRRINGVDYTMQSLPFSEGERVQQIPPSQTRTSTDGVRICTRVAEKQEEILELINEYGRTANLAPGMIFKDDTVLQGAFSAMPGLARKPFQLTVDLVDFSRPKAENLQDVLAPQDLASINDAVRKLLTRLKNAPIPARLTSQVFELHAEAQMRLAMEANASVDLKEVIPLPLEVTANQGFENDSRLELNHVAVAFAQPFFTVSVGNPPWELVNGPPPSDALLVSNVIYGRLAILTASSLLSSQELKASVERIVNAVDLASAEASLTAEAKTLLTSGAIKVRILGGNAQMATAVAVKGMPALRDYIEKLDATVEGALGVPLAYVFRYLSDDAPVFIRGVSQFDNVECRRARRLQITDASIKVHSVSDAPGLPSDEELFGSIKLKLGDATATLWSQGAPLKKAKDQSIKIDGNPEFRIDPASIATQKLSIDFDVKDKIEAGAEYLGASDKAKRDGFVAYSPAGITLSVKDVQNQGGVLKKSYTLAEGNAELQVAMTFRLVE